MEHGAALRERRVGPRRVEDFFISLVHVGKIPAQIESLDGLARSS